MSFIPPTRGSLRCMCWQGYKGDTWEDYAEKQRQAMTRLPLPAEVVKRVQTVEWDVDLDDDE